MVIEFLTQKQYEMVYGKRAPKELNQIIKLFKKQFQPKYVTFEKYDGLTTLGNDYNQVSF